MRPEDDDETPTPQQVTYRRRPQMVSFLVVGAIIGLVAGGSLGYFGPAWMIGTTIEHVLVHYGASLTVEGSSAPDRFAELARDLLRRSLVLVVPLAVVITVGAPWLLRLYGTEFSARIAASDPLTGPGGPGRRRRGPARPRRACANFGYTAPLGTSLQR